MLVLYGAPLALATSAVVLYRVFQAGIPVIVGSSARPTSAISSARRLPR